MKTHGLLLLAFSSAFAFAQEDMCVLDAKAKPFAVRVGLGTFANKGTNDYTKSSSIALGLTYRPGVPCMIAPGKGTPGFDLDFSDVSGNGNRINSLGLTYGSRILLGNGGFYGGFGLGAFQTRVRSGAGTNNGQTRPTRATGDDITPGTSKTMIRPGAKFMLGMNGKSGEFFELNYFLMGDVRGVNVNRASLSVGLKF